MIKIYRVTKTIKAEQFDGSDQMMNKYHIELNDIYMSPFRIETSVGWLNVNRDANETILLNNIQTRGVRK